MKDAIVKTYSKKGEKIVNMNCAAVDAGLTALKKIDVPAGWADLKDEEESIDQSLPTYIREIQIPVNKQAGDKIPVSKFMPYADGVSPVETSKYERRGIATNVPKWIPENCIGCNMCSLVCPHACIRPFLVTEEEKAAGPEGMVTKKAVAKVAMGANPAQLITALKEAEAHKGPSLIIAYAPCINHGLVNGMGKAMMEEKLAVECGYWPLFRYIPENLDKGLNPFILDSKEPNGKLREFMMGEVRFASLTRTFPERAEILFKEAEEFTARRYAQYKAMAGK